MHFLLQRTDITIHSKVQHCFSPVRSSSWMIETVKAFELRPNIIRVKTRICTLSLSDYNWIVNTYLIVYSIEFSDLIRAAIQLWTGYADGLLSSSTSCQSWRLTRQFPLNRSYPNSINPVCAYERSCDSRSINFKSFDREIDPSWSLDTDDCPDSSGRKSRLSLKQLSAHWSNQPMVDLIEHRSNGWYCGLLVVDPRWGGSENPMFDLCSVRSIID